jgi:serine/threonine-protein kinase
LSDDDDSRALERVGSVLNEKWTLERLLGMGGMAAVYAGRHRNGARAAVKMMHPTLSRHREVCERFRREGYAANRVEHPNVVKVLDDDVVASGPDAGTAYLVMELLQGQSLQDRLERGPAMGEREFLAIAAEVLEVLEAAHTRGVVHRDLKPENLFLQDPDGQGGDRPRVKVLDFGLARLLDGQTITTYGLALGTPSFMSPEQAAGRIDEIDGRTDLFALAATGFRLRTGRRIHEGVNAVELVRKMATMAAPRVHTVAPDAGAAFARVIDRALEFNRDDRYEDAAAMREDVRRAMAELDGNARTQLAVNVPPSAPPPPEPTMDVSGSELEVSQSFKETRKLPSKPPAEDESLRPTRKLEARSGDDESLRPTRKLEAKWPSDESIRLPRRRSVVPWIAMAILVGAGGKLWFDARRTRSATPEPAPAAQDSAATSAPEPAHDASAHVAQVASPPPPPPHAAPVASQAATARPQPPPAAPPAAPAGTHRRPPTKVGPGNVHKLRSGHRARRSRRAVGRGQ